MAGIGKFAISSKSREALNYQMGAKPSKNMTKKEVQAIFGPFPNHGYGQLMTELYLKAKLDRAEAAMASGESSLTEVVERSRQWFG